MTKGIKNVINDSIDSENREEQVRLELSETPASKYSNLA